MIHSWPELHERMKASERLRRPMKYRRICPACKREVRLSRRHKKRPGGEWCDEKVDPLRERALDLLVRCHDLAAGWCLDGRYGDVIALLSPLEPKLPPRRTT